MSTWWIHAANAAKKKSATSRNIHSKNTNDTSYSESKSYYSKEEYVYYLIENNEFASNFFELLDRIIDEEELNVRKEICRKLDKQFEAYLKESECVTDLIDEIVKTGIRITPGITSKEHYFPVEPKIGNGFAGMCKYGYNSRSFLVGFNGIKLTVDMLLVDESVKSTYQIDYEDWLDMNPDIEVKISETKIEINKKTKQLKWNIFKRKTIKEEILQLEKKLEKLEENLKIGKTKEKELQMFKNLTTEQKKAIMHYLKQITKCEAIGHNIRELINEEIEYGNRSRRNQLLDIALKNAIQTGKLTNRDIDRISQIFLNEDLSKDTYEKGVITTPVPHQQLIDLYFENQIQPLLDEKVIQQKNNGDSVKSSQKGSR